MCFIPDRLKHAKQKKRQVQRELVRRTTPRSDGTGSASSWPLAASGTTTPTSSCTDGACRKRARTGSLVLSVAESSFPLLLVQKESITTGNFFFPGGLRNGRSGRVFQFSSWVNRGADVFPGWAGVWDCLHLKVAL